MGAAQRLGPREGMGQRRRQRSSSSAAGSAIKDMSVKGNSVSMLSSQVKTKTGLHRNEAAFQSSLEMA